MYSLCWSVGLSCKLDLLPASTGVSSLKEMICIYFKLSFLLQCWQFFAVLDIFERKQPVTSWGFREESISNTGKYLGDMTLFLFFILTLTVQISWNLYIRLQRLFAEEGLNQDGLSIPTRFICKQGGNTSVCSAASGILHQDTETLLGMFLGEICALQSTLLSFSLLLPD